MSEEKVMNGVEQAKKRVRPDRVRVLFKFPGALSGAYNKIVSAGQKKSIIKRFRLEMSKGDFGEWNEDPALTAAGTGEKGDLLRVLVVPFTIFTFVWSFFGFKATDKISLFKRVRIEFSRGEFGEWSDDITLSNRKLFAVVARAAAAVVAIWVFCIALGVALAIAIVSSLGGGSSSCRSNSGPKLSSAHQECFRIAHQIEGVAEQMTLNRLPVKGIESLDANYFPDRKIPKCKKGGTYILEYVGQDGLEYVVTCTKHGRISKPKE